MITHTKTSIFLFTFTICILIQISSPQPLPQAIIKEMASRRVRFHHYIWHNIRDNWNLYSPSTQRDLIDLNWNPPRPSRRFDSQGNYVADMNNGAGEDFLYMHRQMIAKFNSIIAQTNDPYGRVRGWTRLPAPGDSSWPVPSSYSVSGSPSMTSSVRQAKSSSIYYNNIKPQEDDLYNENNLRRWSLGYYGALIENTIHNWLHIRFSSRSPVGYRPGTSGPFSTISKTWDDPSYDWLADSYSSHVNPLFWKIHGWINDRVEAWAAARGLRSIPWSGTWEGGPLSSMQSFWAKQGLRPQENEGEEDHDILEKVFKVIAKEGIESHFTDLNWPKLEKPKGKSRLRKCKAKRFLGGH